MDVISNASAIRSVVIISEHVHLRPPPHSHLQYINTSIITTVSNTNLGNEGHEVVRNAIGIFTSLIVSNSSISEVVGDVKN
jgi:hypothetical protein